MKVTFYIETNAEIEEIQLSMNPQELALLAASQGQEIDFDGRTITIFRISYGVRKDLNGTVFLPIAAVSASVFARQEHDEERVHKGDMEYLDARRELIGKNR